MSHTVLIVTAGGTLIVAALAPSAEAQTCPCTFTSLPLQAAYASCGGQPPKE